MVPRKRVYATVTLLLVAAEPREFRGVLERAERATPLDWPVDWARAAGCGGRRLILVANGAGHRRAAAATAAALARERADAVVSFGFCGALDPALRVADVFVATAVNGPERRFPAGLPQSARAFASGALASVSRIVQTAAEKAGLRSTGASAVEMEAAGVAEETFRSHLPFYCVRSVTDLAAESFTIDFNSVLRADGHFDTMLLLRRVARRPLAALPELVRLGGRCRIAALRLGDFVADCRF